MKSFYPILFATIAAIGNAMFAFGQKRSAGVENGLLFVGTSALVAVMLAFLTAPPLGTFDLALTFKAHWRNIIIGGVGLFLTYLGFNLLYSKFGAAQYVLYAVISIITTTIIVGILWLHEPVNLYQKIAVIMALASVIVFSLGQSKP